jgi:hypothetical protein
MELSRKSEEQMSNVLSLNSFVIQEIFSEYNLMLENAFKHWV